MGEASFGCLLCIVLIVTVGSLMNYDNIGTVPKKAPIVPKKAPIVPKKAPIVPKTDPEALPESVLIVSKIAPAMNEDKMKVLMVTFFNVLTHILIIVGIFALIGAIILLIRHTNNNVCVR